MPDLAIGVLFKGRNFARLMGGLWVTLELSLASIALSIVLGLLLGVVMTLKNPITRAVPPVAGNDPHRAPAGAAVSDVFRAGEGV